ncbi:dienelactone hydrolase family protein [Hyphobacterium indicum]|uniref:dienelactone hydrolase family protein n=1 Tax=Hyphobacterium indicum TaxID=2162714 RepID=UPI000D641CFC|nr:dienelactone hydrolase family protein [Hyphobacterium indicum]
MGWFSLFAFLIALGAGAFVGFRLYQRGLLTPVPRRTLHDMIRNIEPFTDIQIPAGKGPFPAVILLHGCGGIRPNMAVFAKLATELGVMAIVPDSNSFRGIGYEEALETVCTGAKLRASERAGDLHAALEIARQHPLANASQIVIAGWSHGGWTALEALALDQAGMPPASLDQLPPNGLEGVKAIFAMYPYSGFPARSRRMPWRTDIPVESLLVRGDTICDDLESVEVFNRQIKWGADVKWRYVERATHAFDEPDHHPTSSLVYDPERAKIAHTAFQAFLKRYLDLRQDSAD